MPANLHGSIDLTRSGADVIDGGADDSAIKRYGSTPPSLAWQTQTDRAPSMVAQRAWLDHQTPSMQSLAWQTQSEQMQNMQIEAQQALTDHQARSMQPLAWQAGPEQGRDLPSVYWEAVQLESVSSPRSDVAWAEYCSDSEESAGYQDPELATETVHMAVGQSRKEWSAASNAGAY